MKKLILFVFTIITFKTTNAQSRSDNDIKSFFFSGGFELGVPSNSPFGISYGGSAKAEIRVARPLGVTLTGGYNVYNYKGSFLSFSGQSTKLHPAFIPLKAGLKYFAGPGFYGEGELGTALKANYGSGNMFAYAIGFGFEASLNSYSDIDIGFRYEGYSENQYQVTGIRIAYRVGW